MRLAFLTPRRVLSGLLIVSGLLLMSLPLAGVTHAGGFTLVDVGTTFNTPIGIDYHAPDGKLVFSVNYSSGEDHNFDLIDQSGVHSQFSNIHGLTDEVYIASPRTTQGGFTAGELFTGNGNPGQITRISPDGSSIIDPWVTLPDSGLLRGGLHMDDTGVANNDLVVVTDAGGVYRIEGNGTVHTVAQLGHFLEGVTTIPNNPVLYGPWAGQIIAGDEQNGLIYSINPTTGASQSWNLGIPEPENFNVVPAASNWYGVDFADGKIKSAPAADWVGMIGDIAIGSQSPGILYDVRWNGSQFVATQLAQVGQWEGATFAPVSLPGVPQIATPEAPSSILFGAGAALFLLGLGIRSRRRKSAPLA